MIAHLAMTYVDTKNLLTSHADSVGGSRSLTYDARGNVTALGSLGFTYDMSSDQPTAISGSASGSYTYDGNLKRVKSVVDGTTIYNVYDASGTLIHVDNTTSGESTDYLAKIARITKKDGVDTITYLHADQLGSANTGTDKDGNILWREQYTPFGRTLNSPPVNNDQAGFTGHIKDSATGLNYMQARYYDPLIGRFLSTDPVSFMDTGEPSQFNRYTYGNNDPINMFDPDGLDAFKIYDPDQAVNNGHGGAGFVDGSGNVSAYEFNGDGSFVPIDGLNGTTLSEGGVDSDGNFRIMFNSSSSSTPSGARTFDNSYTVTGSRIRKYHD